MERTLFIIKPDAVRRNLTGQILSMVEGSGLRVIAMRMTNLSGDEAGRFYRVHREKDFYEKLVSYMSSGRCVAVAVDGEQAVERLRRICGATDPAVAERDTIRARFGLSITMNSVHASDSSASAAEEVTFFFPELA